ncbi:MAG TPA: hypothetical protein PK179_03260 [Spirochaetales bacterium]|nr:hypothetical protein [Spirochaetales bacterium]HPM72684.1 hypothetical protein [Spirochaetales bacterium]
MSAFDGLGTVIQGHIRQIVKTSGLRDGQESLEKLAEAWTMKREAFEAATREHGLEEVSFFGAEEERGALALTYSGSIVTIWPLDAGKRRCEYASVGLRADVPQSATEPESTLSADVETDGPIAFSRGPVKSTSPVFKIAVAAERLPLDEETTLLTQVAGDVAEDFARVNRTVVL